MAQNSEASVEEILESIKKVIARDNRKDAPKPSARRSEPEADFEDEDEVLELDETLIEESEGGELADSNPELTGATMSDNSDDPNEDPPLVGKDAQGAMKENLAALAMLAEPGAKPQIVRSGETSLEGLARELLRPMLAEWLDQNLPGMVEKMVQAEIARIAGKRR